MARAIVIFFFLPALVICSKEGNIHLLEEEIQAALNTCPQINHNENQKDDGKRQKRFDASSYSETRIDASPKMEINPYSHIRRNTSLTDQMHILNETEYDYPGYGAGGDGEKYVKSIPRPTQGKNVKNNSYYYNGKYRIKRNELLINKNDNDQCLSQCVFANLHVVDSQGIPREAELWNTIKTSVTSQQSRVLLRDQIRACFQEMQYESEDNGCSYSNKLERCLMLRFSDRKINGTQIT